MSTIKFYGNIISQPSRMISYVMERLNIDHEYVFTQFVKDTRSEHYLKNVNKFGQVPCIHDGDLKLAESAAIARYLCDLYDKDEVLLPRTDRKFRAKVESILDYNGHSGKPNFSKAYVPIGLAPRLRNAVPPADDEFDKLIGDVNLTLAHFESLVTDHDYVAGEKFTIADIQLYNEVINWEAFTGLKVEGYEHIDAWRKRIGEDEVQAKLDKEFWEALDAWKPPQSHDVILYGIYGSQPVRTVIYVLEKLKISYLYVPVEPFKQTRSKEFKRQINKNGTVPVIKHDGVLINESATIIRYL